MDQIRIFISYSWDSEEHRDWVRKLADSLEEISEIHVTWDGYDLDSLVDKNLFMESGVFEADLILVIATKKYKEKADSRIGGVGLETFMTSAVHWNTLLKEKKSKLLIIRREEESTPRYLEGHLYFDFSKDLQYDVKLEELLDQLRGARTIERPKKRRNLSVKNETYDFTRVEELIKINHPNRTALVNVADGTDYSGNNRIKYELWETRSPSKGYFFALHTSINIVQTATHAAKRLISLGIRPKEITVLRQRSARPEQELIAKAFSENKLSTEIHECTYKEYIWDYCIDETLKAVDSPATIENYTNQGLTFNNDESEELVRLDSALDYFVDILQKPSSVAAHLVIAPGGMGKTSLCLSIAKKLHFRDDLRSSVVLIQAESIKKYIADKGVVPSRIGSIYDIYELYVKYQGHGALFERSIFDLAVVCGNLTIIIDGLDELSSLFQDKFDVEAFLESLKYLHDQLGSSNILLTTRSNVVAEKLELDALSIPRYNLLGFDNASCKKYVTKRLQHYSDSQNLIQKVMAQIEKVLLKEIDDRIIPFLADVVTTVAEDELNAGTLNGQGFQVFDDPTPYSSNNEFIDHIVHSILRREETRQGLGIPIGEVVEVLSGLVTDYGKRWLMSELESRLQMIYESRAQSILTKLKMSPLLIVQDKEIELRYSFLGSYFEVLFMLQGISRSSLEAETSRALARLNSDSEEARDLRRYFESNIVEVSKALKILIPKLRDRAVSADNKRSTLERENDKGAIASLLYLYCSAHKKSIDVVTEKILDVYSVSNDKSTSRTLDGIFVKDSFPALDFTNLIVTNSRFRNYTNFLSSRFSNTKFIYSQFEGCAGSAVLNKNLDVKMFDSSCELGDLREVFELVKATKGDEEAMIHSETVRFLNSFFRSDRFIDNKLEYIKFSTKVQGLARDKFDRLIAQGFIVLVKEKSVANFYEIATNFKASTRKFLTDGYPDGRIKRFIDFIR